MKRFAFFLLTCFALWAGTAGHVAAADGLTAAQLERLLQSSPRASAPFEETRESPWLSVPATSRGTMHSTPRALEKRVESPRQETWRMLPDRLELSAGGSTKQITFVQAPALAALSDVMRRVISGEITALERDFRIELSGDERVWRAQLTPRAADVARHISTVELQGTGARLQVVIVSQRQGERTTTRLLP